MADGSPFADTLEAGRTLVVLGDSFVAGEGDPDGCGWVGRLAAAARERLPSPSTVYGLGVCGDTAVDVAARWRAEVRARSATRTVTHALLAVGTNDVVACAVAEEAGAEGPCGVASTEALVGVVDGLLGLGCAVGVVGTPPLHAPRLDAIGDGLDARWSALAGERDVRWFPVRGALAADPRWLRALQEAPDGIHPDAPGYRAFAEVLLEQGLLDWLGDPSAVAAGAASDPAAS